MVTQTHTPARPSRSQRPVPPTAIALNAAAYSLCPLARWLLGPRRYARRRSTLISLARLLTMRFSLLVGYELGPLPLRFGRFLVRLLMTTLGFKQVAVSGAAAPGGPGHWLDSFSHGGLPTHFVCSAE